MLISNLEIEVNFLNKVKTLLLINPLYARGHGFQTDSRGLFAHKIHFLGVKCTLTGPSVDGSLNPDF